MSNKGRRLRHTLACAAMLATSLTPQAWAQADSAAPQPAGASSAAAETGLTVRPEIGVLLRDAQRLLGEKKSPEAADKLRAAEAIADKTSYELHILARLKGALAVATDDAAQAAQQYELASQGPWLSQSDRLLGLQSVIGLYYKAKDYGKAIEWIVRYRQAGGGESAMNLLLAQSYYLAADYANAAQALEAEIGKATSTGQAPAERQLLLLADARSRLPDDGGYAKAMEWVVRYYPSKANWRTLLGHLWAKPQLAARLQLDLFRFQLASIGFSQASDYSQMAQLALQEGSAIEAAKLLEQGRAAGLLGGADSSGELRRLGDKIAKSAAEDRSTLEKDVARARTLPDGLAMFNYGFNLFQLGQTERGLAQMEQGLAKGIARNSDLARLRLVAAYAQLDQRDKAIQLLSALAGKSEPVGLAELARYWNLWLRRP